MKKWSFETKRDIMLYVFILMLLAQTLLYVRITESPYLFSNESYTLQESKEDISEIFIKDTVRAEQRRALTAIRQAWIQYLFVHPEIELLQTDNTWNEEVVKEIISIIAEPLRLFDTNSELIVADVYTGNILIAPALKEEQRAAIQLYGKPNLQAYYKLSAYHSNYTQKLYKEILTKVDSDRNTVLTSLICEPNNISDDVNNFSKYPLGSYNRKFIEKIILPYESIGVNGLENMQLVVILSVSEQDIMKPYLQKMSTLDKSFEEMHASTVTAKRGLKLSIMLSIISMIACIIYTRILGHHGINQK